MRGVKAVTDRAASVIALLSRACGVVAAASLFFMAVSTTYDVVMRYFLNRATVWATETSGYLLVLATMFGAVYTLYHGGHINIVLLYRRFSPRTQTLLAAGTGFLAVLFVAALVWKGTDMTVTAYRQGGKHIGDMYVPQWLTYQLIPIGGFLLGLELLRQLYQNLVSSGRR